jgi:hypothetical protein
MITNKFPQFYKNWIKGIRKNKNRILSKKILGIVSRNGKIRSIFIDTKVKTKNNDIYRRSILIEKAGVIIIPILYFKNTIYTILVKQFRICKGSETYEFPSGQAEDNNLYSQAVKELYEETAIIIKKKEIKKLDCIQMITSSNSVIANYFYFKKKIGKNFFKKFNNKKTGVRSDEELISLKIFKLKNLYKHKTANIYSGLSMLRKRNIIRF